jgi:hypothetical protein
VNLTMVGPGGKPGERVELPKKTADNLVGILLRAETIELLHHADQRSLDIANRALGIVLTLLLETPLALHELFTIET